MERRLYRSESDQMLSGVSGGLAEYFDIDPVIVRLLWVILTIFSGGLLIVVYGAFWIVMPTYSSIYGDEPEERDAVVDLESEDVEENGENEEFQGSGNSESERRPRPAAGGRSETGGSRAVAQIAAREHEAITAASTKTRANQCGNWRSARHCRRDCAAQQLPSVLRSVAALAADSGRHRTRDPGGEAVQWPLIEGLVEAFSFLDC